MKSEIITIHRISRFQERSERLQQSRPNSPSHAGKPAALFGPAQLAARFGVSGFLAIGSTHFGTLPNQIPFEIGEQSARESRVARLWLNVS